MELRSSRPSPANHTSLTPFPWACAGALLCECQDVDTIGTLTPVVIASQTIRIKLIMNHPKSNIPHPAAHLISLAIVTDGLLNSDQEIQTLERTHAHTKLGLSLKDFDSALFATCIQLVESTNVDDDHSPYIDGRLVQKLLNGVTDPGQRLIVGRAVFDIIRTDRFLHPAEAKLFWSMVDTWQIKITDLSRLR